MDHVLVAPVVHKEQVTEDFTVEEYLSLQRMIHRVVEATRRTVETERVYILSLGPSQFHEPGSFFIPFCEGADGKEVNSSSIFCFSTLLAFKYLGRTTSNNSRLLFRLIMSLLRLACSPIGK